MRDVPLSYYATITGSLAIAVGLVVVSYGHIRTFAIEAGAAPWEAAVIAVTVDALVVLSIAAIGHARSVGHTPPAMAKIALVVGIVATTGANVHHGLGYGWAGIVVSLWVPVAAELAYQLAMSAVRIGAHGHQPGETRPAICGGRMIHVATVMSRVAAARAVAEEQVEREASAVSARPVICGRTVPVATLTRTALLAALDTRPVICGTTVSAGTLADTLPTREEAPVICHQVATVEELVAPLSGVRPMICGGHLVSAVEVLAPVRAAVPRAPSPVAVSAPTSVATGEREDAVMEWLTDPATEVAVDTATGADIVELLAGTGHGPVSERTGRRILSAVRAAMADTPVAA
ncbi:DUF2637 domain-containing protein [Nocardiopsis salina]|uniref:DUF2637 domain-containing protein n=1 Tax=Nocardiopsis salina TaxID=245836 RepID=UPI00034BD6E7|nr:DUF2637 domain-containing protein [Nocardiopsis salina]